MKNVYKDKVIVITGGSSGIGLALAKEFAKQKAKLVLIGRDKGKLTLARIEVEKISQSTVLDFSADVSSLEAISSAIEETALQLGGIDVLISNAGIISTNRFEELTSAEIENCLTTNFLGAAYVSKASWPWLKKSKGQLSFVSSVAGYIGLIGYSAYSPTKFALVGLAESLRMEGKNEGIRVSIIYPPDTDTSLLKYERDHALPETKALNKKIKTYSPEKVARIYIRGLQKNKFQIYCDFNSRFIRWVKNNFPSIFRYITDRIARKATSLPIP